MSTREIRTDHDVPSGAVVAFFGLTFLITWGVVGAYIVAPDRAVALFGEISGTHPLFFVATWGPAIAGIAIVLWYGGLAGLKSFLSRLGLWRIGLPWLLLVLVGIPLVFMLGSTLKGGPLLAPVPEDGPSTLLVVALVMLALGPVEEFGWRGVAQPILQRHVAPVWAGVLIGLAWGVWHLPAFFLAGVVFAEWSFVPFLIGNVALAVLVTAVFNETRGSLLWPILFHWQLILPVWPDAQPYDTWMMVIIAVAVVWVRRDAMLSRDGAVTRVIPHRHHIRRHVTAQVR